VGVIKLYKVKEVADMAGVSVRTLHYYDRIGLLVPESVTPAGYRLYTTKNLEKLQQILFFKEIGFTLQEIKAILDNPNFDRKKALKEHKELLLKKRDRIEEMIRTVDNTIQSIEGEMEMENKDMFKGFDMKAIEEHQKKYADEIKERYGVDAMEELAKNSEDEWTKIMKRADEIYKELAANMDKSPDDPVVQKAVGEWRQHITDNFYDCTIEIFRGLGDLYVDDERFTKNIDKYKEGLAKFLREAIYVYCDHHTR
jgi:MerR family transcriptional regulator, multidrug-efflux activator